MAVTKLECVLNGKEYSFNVNVRKNGIFKVVYGWEFAQKVGLEHDEYSATELKKIEDPFYEAVRKYQNANKKYFAKIGIDFTVSPEWLDKNLVDAPGNGHKLIDRTFGSISRTPNIGFDYHIYLVEEVGGAVSWYAARPYEKSIDLDNFENKEYYPGFTKGQAHWNCATRHAIMYDYTPELHENLKNAKQMFTDLATKLFLFFGQEPEKLEQVLNKSKISLLNPPK